MKYLFIMDAGIGILMVVLAIPMILQKVRPNLWYGFRTRKTLSDERVWYPANRYAGKALLAAGGVTTVGAAALSWVANRPEYGLILSEALLSVLYLIMLSVPLVACVIASFAYLRRL